MAALKGKFDFDRSAERVRRAVADACLLAVAMPLLGLGAGGVAWAQAEENSGENDEALPRYAVELIVFTHSDNDSEGEIFLPDERPEAIYGLPQNAPVYNDEQSGAEVPSASDLADAPLGRPLPEVSRGHDEPLRELPTWESIRLRLLPPDDYSMGNVYNQLVRLDAYEPLMHAAWTQSTPPKAVAPSLRLRALGSPPLGLDGTVTLYRGRFVHLSIDLALDAGKPADASSGTRVYSDARTGSEDLLGTGRNVVRYRINEDRILRSGDIRYFDHPRFGVLVKLSVVEENPNDEDNSPIGIDGAGPIE